MEDVGVKADSALTGSMPSLVFSAGRLTRSDSIDDTC